jgi:hypothetical protein
MGNNIIMHYLTENIGKERLDACFMLVTRYLATAMETVELLPFFRPIYATERSRIHSSTAKHHATFGGELLKLKVGIFFLNPKRPLPKQTLRDISTEIRPAT